MPNDPTTQAKIRIILADAIWTNPDTAKYAQMASRTIAKAPLAKTPEMNGFDLVGSSEERV
jgi:hypothetical protein